MNFVDVIVLDEWKLVFINFSVNNDIYVKINNKYFIIMGFFECKKVLGIVKFFDNDCVGIDIIE